MQLSASQWFSSSHRGGLLSSALLWACLALVLADRHRLETCDQATNSDVLGTCGEAFGDLDDAAVCIAVELFIEFLQRMAGRLAPFRCRIGRA